MRGPRRPGEAGLDRLGSVTLSRFLVPDLDFWVAGFRGHRRRSESGINNRPPGTKLRRSGTKGRRTPGTTTDSVNLGLRRPEDAWDWTFC